ncbi:hypothetical protein [Bowmanella sp. JS7-9]|uniref:Uncharacterized protein n=1 Tax=Pseudobowmanella zhangzhouensis TaxID=1537679 RepID=A0ABW1XHL1_9ALTE|nr:hypothetical protein [Bowmanella sp. JS7-9]
MADPNFKDPFNVKYLLAALVALVLMALAPTLAGWDVFFFH